MTSDLYTDVVYRITTPQILSSETIVPARTASAAVDLGRRLLVAARAGDTPAVLDLMAKGAPFSTDWLGTSPLHLAALHAHLETCAVLLRAGVSRDSRTKVERTPLHLAAYKGHAHIVSLLLEHGAQVDCRDMLRMTPLHWAVERGHSSVVSILLRHGADPSAESKFHKSPHLLAQQHHPQMVKLIEDAVKEREAAISVDALVNEHMTDTAMPEQSIQTFETIVQRIHEAIPTNTPDPQEERSAKPKTSESEGVSNEATAAQILRKHGITLLPNDDGSTVLNAIQSGRTVVLSDAGKLMLKESETLQLPTTIKTSCASQKGVVLTATPVKSPPKPGVKIFTLNNKLIAMPKDNNKTPVKKIINPTDLQLVKILQLPPEAKIITTNKTTIPMKAKNKLSPRPMASALTSNRTTALGQRPAVKIIMNKTNFNKLMANANKTVVDQDVIEIHSPTAETQSLEEDVEEILRVPDEVVARCSTEYLRTHALAARQALQRLKEELHATRERLAQYEQ